MTSIEVWRGVDSLDGKIEVSSFGRARRLERKFTYKDGRTGTLPAGLLKGSLMSNGYHQVSFGEKKLLMHRLVAEAFLGAESESFAYQTVNHKNGDKLDNRPENLEWATYTRNNTHARDTGLNDQHGENTNLSKFSNQLVSAMLKVRDEFRPTNAKLADLFGMSETTIRDIISGKSRKRG